MILLHGPLVHLHWDIVLSVLYQIFEKFPDSILCSGK